MAGYIGKSLRKLFWNFFMMQWDTLCSLAKRFLYAHRAVTSHSYQIKSSSTRNLNTLCQVQCRAQVDTLMYCVLCWFSPNFSHIMAAVKIRKLDIFYKVNVDQAVWIHDNSSDCKVSKRLPFARTVYLVALLLITRSDYLSMQRWVIFLCNGDRFSFLWCMNWILYI